MPAKKKLPKVRVRTYRHGLGDCHLLTFRKPNGSPLHMLIDCGVVDLTKEPEEVMGRVAKDIAKESGGALDVVVATHAHTDHLSGFKQAAATFKDVKFKRLWLAWTEKKSNPRRRKIQRELVKKLGAAREAASRLAALGKTHPPSAAAALRINGVLDFFGPAASGSEMQAIMDELHEKAIEPPDYYEPGMVFPLPGVPNVRVYVLGPPMKSADYRVMDPRKSKHEGYEAALAASAEGFVDALGDGESELSQPFDRRYRRTPADAEANPLFQCYFAPDPDAPENPHWRRIDTTWLEMAEQLALFLDDYTNNSSLALAFEFIDSDEVLLFPGDAQIGSWLTWHGLEWTVEDDSGSKRTVRTSDLFAKTVFYKASHHASHNGTLSGFGENQTGLEHMNSRDLVCVVPVDREMSKKKHWDRTLPWQPLLNRLTERTRGRLILTDIRETPPDAENLANLSAAERKRFARQVVVTPEWIEYKL